LGHEYISPKILHALECSIFSNTIFYHFLHSLGLLTVEDYLPTLCFFFQTVATVCVFLASKMEDTPCLLKHVVIVAYETMYQKNPDAAKRIHQEVFNFLHL
jgi:hypothetical protein